MVTIYEIKANLLVKRRIAMRHCYRCNKDKVDDEFWKTCAYCKPCDLEYRKEWREKNKQKHRERRMVLWRRKHSRPCKNCGELYVGRGVKRQHCSTKCKLLDNIIKRKNGCWDWQGEIHPNGYGFATNYEKNKKGYVHRVSYEIFKGQIPDGLCVCHTCDNRCCIAPDHLWIGTSKENNNDAKIKGRTKHVKLFAPKGENNGSSKLKEFEVKEIKKMISEGEKIAVIARKYNISWSVIDSIKRNLTWRHVLQE